MHLFEKWLIAVATAISFSFTSVIPFDLAQAVIPDLSKSAKASYLSVVATGNKSRADLRKLFKIDQLQGKVISEEIVPRAELRNQGNLPKTTEDLLKHGQELAQELLDLFDPLRGYLNSLDRSGNGFTHPILEPLMVLRNAFSFFREPNLKELDPELIQKLPDEILKFKGYLEIFSNPEQLEALTKFANGIGEQMQRLELLEKDRQAGKSSFKPFNLKHLAVFIQKGLYTADVFDRFAKFNSEFKLREAELKQIIEELKSRAEPQKDHSDPRSELRSSADSPFTQIISNLNLWLSFAVSLPVCAAVAYFLGNYLVRRNIQNLLQAWAEREGLEDKLKIVIQATERMGQIGKQILLASSQISEANLSIFVQKLSEAFKELDLDLLNVSGKSPKKIIGLDEIVRRIKAGDTEFSVHLVHGSPTFSKSGKRNETYEFQMRSELRVWKFFRQQFIDAATIQQAGVWREIHDPGEFWELLKFGSEQTHKREFRLFKLILWRLAIPVYSLFILSFHWIREGAFNFPGFYPDVLIPIALILGPIVMVYALKQFIARKSAERLRSRVQKINLTLGKPVQINLGHFQNEKLRIRLSDDSMVMVQLGKRDEIRVMKQHEELREGKRLSRYDLQKAIVMQPGEAIYLTSVSEHGIAKKNGWQLIRIDSSPIGHFFEIKAGKNGIVTIQLNQDIAWISAEVVHKKPLFSVLRNIYKALYIGSLCFILGYAFSFSYIFLAPRGPWPAILNALNFSLLSLILGLHFPDFLMELQRIYKKSISRFDSKYDFRRISEIGKESAEFRERTLLALASDELNLALTRLIRKRTFSTRQLTDPDLVLLQRLALTVTTESSVNREIEDELINWVYNTNDLRILAAIMAGWWQAKPAQSSDEKRKYSRTLRLVDALFDRFRLSRDQLKRIQQLADIKPKNMGGEANFDEPRSEEMPLSYKTQLENRLLHRQLGEDEAVRILKNLNSIDSIALTDWIFQQLKSKYSDADLKNVRTVFVLGSFVYGVRSDPTDLDLHVIVEGIPNFEKFWKYQVPIDTSVFRNDRARVTDFADVHFLSRNDLLKNPEVSALLANTGVILQAPHLLDEPLHSIRASEWHRFIKAKQLLSNAKEKIEKMDSDWHGHSNAIPVWRVKAQHSLEQVNLHLRLIDPSIAISLQDMGRLRLFTRLYLEGDYTDEDFTDVLRLILNRLETAHREAYAALIWRELQKLDLFSTQMSRRAELRRPARDFLAAGILSIAASLTVSSCVGLSKVQTALQNQGGMERTGDEEPSMPDYSYLNDLNAIHFHPEEYAVIPDAHWGVLFSDQSEMLRNEHFRKAINDALIYKELFDPDFIKYNYILRSSRPWVEFYQYSSPIKIHRILDKSDNLLLEPILKEPPLSGGKTELKGTPESLPADIAKLQMLILGDDYTFFKEWRSARSEAKRSELRHVIEMKDTEIAFDPRVAIQATNDVYFMSHEMINAILVHAYHVSKNPRQPDQDENEYWADMAQENMVRPAIMYSGGNSREALESLYETLIHLLEHSHSLHLKWFRKNRTKVLEQLERINQQPSALITTSYFEGGWREHDLRAALGHEFFHAEFGHFFKTAPQKAIDVIIPKIRSYVKLHEIDINYDFVRTAHQHLLDAHPVKKLEEYAAEYLFSSLGIDEEGHAIAGPNIERYERKRKEAEQIKEELLAEFKFLKILHEEVLAHANRSLFHALRTYQIARSGAHQFLDRRYEGQVPEGKQFQRVKMDPDKLSVSFTIRRPRFLSNQWFLRWVARDFDIYWVPSQYQLELSESGQIVLKKWMKVQDSEQESEGFYPVSFESEGIDIEAIQGHQFTLALDSEWEFKSSSQMRSELRTERDAATMEREPTIPEIKHDEPFISTEVRQAIHKLLEAQQDDPKFYRYGLVSGEEIAAEIGMVYQDFQEKMEKSTYEEFNYEPKQENLLIPIFVSTNIIKNRIILTLRTMEALWGVSSIREINMIRMFNLRSRWRIHFPGIKNVTELLSDVNRNQIFMRRLRLRLMNQSELKQNLALVYALLSLFGTASASEIKSVSGLTAGPANFLAHYPIDEEFWNYNLSVLGLSPIHTTLVHHDTKRVQDQIVHALEQLGGFATSAQISSYAGIHSKQIHHFLSRIDWREINRKRAEKGLFPLGVFRQNRNSEHARSHNTWNGIPIEGKQFVAKDAYQSFLKEAEQQFSEAFGGKGKMPIGFVAFKKITLPWLYRVVFSKNSPYRRLIDTETGFLVMRAVLKMIIDTALEHELPQKKMVRRMRARYSKALDDYFRTIVPRALNVGRKEIEKAGLIKIDSLQPENNPHLTKFRQQLKYFINLYLNGKSAVSGLPSNYPGNADERQRYLSEAQKTYMEYQEGRAMIHRQYILSRNGQEKSADLTTAKSRNRSRIFSKAEVHAVTEALANLIAAGSIRSDGNFKLIRSEIERNPKNVRSGIRLTVHDIGRIIRMNIDLSKALQQAIFETKPRTVRGMFDTVVRNAEAVLRTDDIKSRFKAQKAYHDAVKAFTNHPEVSKIKLNPKPNDEIETNSLILDPDGNLLVVIGRKKEHQRANISKWQMRSFTDPRNVFFIGTAQMKALPYYQITVTSSWKPDVARTGLFRSELRAEESPFTELISKPDFWNSLAGTISLSALMALFRQFNRHIDSESGKLQIFVRKMRSELRSMNENARRLSHKFLDRLGNTPEQNGIEEIRSFTDSRHWKLLSFITKTSLHFAGFLLPIFFAAMFFTSDWSAPLLELINTSEFYSEVRKDFVWEVNPLMLWFLGATSLAVFLAHWFVKRITRLIYRLFDYELVDKEFKTIDLSSGISIRMPRLKLGQYSDNVVTFEFSRGEVVVLYVTKDGKIKLAKAERLEEPESFLSFDSSQALALSEGDIILITGNEERNRSLKAGQQIELPTIDDGAILRLGIGKNRTVKIKRYSRKTSFKLVRRDYVPVASRYRMAEYVLSVTLGFLGMFGSLAMGRFLVPVPYVSDINVKLQGPELTLAAVFTALSVLAGQQLFRLSRDISHIGSALGRAKREPVQSAEDTDGYFRKGIQNERISKINQSRLSPFESESEVSKKIAELIETKNGRVPVADSVLLTLQRMAETVLPNMAFNQLIENYLREWLRATSDKRVWAAIMTGWFQASSVTVSGRPIQRNISNFKSFLKKELGLPDEDVTAIARLALFKDKDRYYEKVAGDQLTSKEPPSYVEQIQTRTPYRLMGEREVERIVSNLDTIRVKELKEWAWKKFMELYPAATQAEIASIKVFGSYVYGVRPDPTDLDLYIFVKNLPPDLKVSSKTLSLESDKRVFNTVFARFTDEIDIKFFSEKDLIVSSEDETMIANVGISLVGDGLADFPLNFARQSNRNRLMKALNLVNDAEDKITRTRKTLRHADNDPTPIWRQKAERRIEEANLLLAAIDPSITIPFDQIRTLRTALRLYMDGDLKQKTFEAILGSFHLRLEEALMLARTTMVWQMLKKVTAPLRSELRSEEEDSYSVGAERLSKMSKIFFAIGGPYLLFSFWFSNWLPTHIWTLWHKIGFLGVSLLMIRSILMRPHLMRASFAVLKNFSGGWSVLSSDHPKQQYVLNELGTKALGLQFSPREELLIYYKKKKGIFLIKRRAVGWGAKFKVHYDASKPILLTRGSTILAGRRETIDHLGRFAENRIAFPGASSAVKISLNSDRDAVTIELLTTHDVFAVKKESHVSFQELNLAMDGMVIGIPVMSGAAVGLLGWFYQNIRYGLATGFAFGLSAILVYFMADIYLKYFARAASELTRKKTSSKPPFFSLFERKYFLKKLLDSYEPIVETHISGALNWLKEVRAKKKKRTSVRTLMLLAQLGKTVSPEKAVNRNIEDELIEWVKNAEDYRAAAVALMSWSRGAKLRSVKLMDVLTREIGFSKKMARQLIEYGRPDASGELMYEPIHHEAGQNHPVPDYLPQIKTRTVYGSMESSEADLIGGRLQSIDVAALKKWLEEKGGRTVRSIFAYGSFPYGVREEPTDIDLIAVVEGEDSFSKEMAATEIPKSIFMNDRPRFTDFTDLRFVTRKVLFESPQKLTLIANVGILLKGENLLDEPLNGARESDYNRLMLARPMLKHGRTMSNLKDAGHETRFQDPIAVFRGKAARRMDEVNLLIAETDPSVSLPPGDMSHLRRQFLSYLDGDLEHERFQAALLEKSDLLRAALFWAQASVMRRKLEPLLRVMRKTVSQTEYRVANELKRSELRKSRFSKRFSGLAMSVVVLAPDAKVNLQNSVNHGVLEINSKIETIQRTIEPEMKIFGENAKQEKAAPIIGHGFTFVDQGLLLVPAFIKMFGTGVVIATNEAEIAALEPIRGSLKDGEELIVAGNYEEALAELNERGFKLAHFIFSPADFIKEDLRQNHFFTIFSKNKIDGMLHAVEEVRDEIQADLAVAYSA